MKSLCKPAGRGRNVVVKIEGKAKDHRLADDEQADSKSNTEAGERLVGCGRMSFLAALFAETEAANSSSIRLRAVGPRRPEMAGAGDGTRAVVAGFPDYFFSSFFFSSTFGGVAPGSV